MRVATRPLQPIRLRTAIRSARRRPATGFALLAVLLIANCGCQRRSAEDPAATHAPSRLAPDGLRGLSVYFSDPGGQRLVPVTRYLRPDSGLARGAVLALLAGPDPTDRARGLASAVPPGSRLLGLTVRDSVATVDLTRAFESGGGATAVRMRLAQLVYTLTRVPGVRWVRLPVSLTNGNNADINGVVGSDAMQDVVPLQWEDRFVIRGGLEHQVNQRWAARAGYCYGKSPVPEGTLTPLTAAIMEHSMTLGVGYQGARYGLDFAYELDLPTARRVGTSGLQAGEYNSSRTEVALHWLTAMASLRF